MADGKKDGTPRNHRGRGDHDFKDELTGGGAVQPDTSLMEQFKKLREEAGLDRLDPKKIKKPEGPPTRG